MKKKKGILSIFSMHGGHHDKHGKPSKYVASQQQPVKPKAPVKAEDYFPKPVTILKEEDKAFFAHAIKDHDEEDDGEVVEWNGFKEKFDRHQEEWTKQQTEALARYGRKPGQCTIKTGVHEHHIPANQTVQQIFTEYSAMLRILPGSRAYQGTSLLSPSTIVREGWTIEFIKSSVERGMILVPGYRSSSEQMQKFEVW